MEALAAGGSPPAQSTAALLGNTRRFTLLSTDRESHTQLHGALRFLKRARLDPDLIGCAYLAAFARPTEAGVYPGSPALALRELGANASYVFCDIDSASAATLRTADTLRDVRVVGGDGIARHRP